MIMSAVGRHARAQLVLGPRPTGPGATSVGTAHPPGGTATPSAMT